MVLGAIILWVSLSFSLTVASTAPPVVFHPEELHSLRGEVKEMFVHTYDNYMNHAYPSDELCPLSCRPRDRSTEARGHMDDILGNFSLTLVDSLDTLAVFGNFTEFEQGIIRLNDTLEFDQDVTVSVFETTIRVLGGLLGIHMAAVEHSTNLSIHYDDDMLRLAIQLGDRMMPAFNTPTGIPYSRVNLRHGVLPAETVETCTAGAGTLILEFGALSRLSRNPKYERVARKSLVELYKRRSPLDLLGNVVNVINGNWIQWHSSIGAGADSYYEYLLKAYVLFGDEEYYRMFDTLNRALRRFVKQGDYYLQANMWSGFVTRVDMIDSLQAFWPGLMVLHGDLHEARDMHAKLFKIWKQLGLLPEAYNTIHSTPIMGWGGYPLRPEFIESTYFLYLATRDPIYLDVGKRVLRDLQNFTRVPCGFAAVADPLTRRLEDRLDSFFLSETLKYLYLLFDQDNHYNRGKHVFTTEGHPFPFDQLLEVKGEEEDSMCPQENRLDVFSQSISRNLSIDYLSNFPGNVWGVEEFDKVVTSSSTTVPPPSTKPSIIAVHLVMQGYKSETVEPVILQLTEPPLLRGIYRAAPSAFGPTLNLTGVEGELVLVSPMEGCTTIQNKEMVRGKIALASRGGCTFVEKVNQLTEAGAIAAIIGNDRGDHEIFIPSGANGLWSTIETSIPSGLISKADFTLIYNSLGDTTPLMASPVHANLFATEQWNRKEDRLVPIWESAVLRMHGPAILEHMKTKRAQHNWVRDQAGRLGLNVLNIKSISLLHSEEEVEELATLTQENLQELVNTAIDEDET